MRSISFWAKSNPWQARLLIVLLYFPLNLAAIQTSNLLLALNIVMSVYWYLATFLCSILAVIIYNTSKKRPGKAGYRGRTAGHLLLLSATFALICAGSNRMDTREVAFIPFTKSLQAASVPGTHSVTGNEPPLYKTMGRKELKQLRRYFVKTIRHTKALSKDEKILLMIITIVGTVGLAFLLAALSCSIACSGSEVLAVFVLALGAAGIAIGATMLLRHIFRHPTRANSPSTRSSANEPPVF